MCQIKVVRVLPHVEVSCASPPAGLHVAALLSHGAGQGLVQMVIPPLLQPYLGLLAAGKGVSALAPPFRKSDGTAVQSDRAHASLV